LEQRAFVLQDPHEVLGRFEFEVMKKQAAALAYWDDRAELLFR
jgi:hypothetical protein